MIIEYIILALVVLSIIWSLYFTLKKKCQHQWRTFRKVNVYTTASERYNMISAVDYHQECTICGEIRQITLK